MWVVALPTVEQGREHIYCWVTSGMPWAVKVSLAGCQGWAGEMTDSLVIGKLPSLAEELCLVSMVTFTTRAWLKLKECVT